VTVGLIPVPKGHHVTALPASFDETLAPLSSASYLADRSLATVLFLALCMGRPTFLEGEAGAGESEIANCSATHDEGLDVASAVYEWNYTAQMIAIRLAEGDADRERLSHDVVSENFLIKRPLLRALEPDTAGAPVVLIDEFDRTDEAFEAYLLEVLANYQVTILARHRQGGADRQSLRLVDLVTRRLVKRKAAREQLMARVAGLGRLIGLNARDVLLGGIFSPLQHGAPV
jgi:hypothetical protein